MQKLLTIERSATLGHLLQRTLSVGKFSDISKATSYEDGLWLLQESAAGAEDFAAVIIGAPAQRDEEFMALLDHLAGGPALGIPVLLVAHDEQPILVSWRKARARSALALWTNFGRIPSILKRILPEVPEAAVQKIQARQVKVLFVDDSQSVRFAYRQLLESNGYEVDVAADIAEAKGKVQNVDYDLVIVDYFLPDGSGDELVRNLTSSPRTKEIFVAVITGTYRESAIKSCLEAGAVECMFKNEAKELFLARVDSLARTIEIQKSVKTEKQRLDGILGSVGDGVYGVDNQGVITFVNPVGSKMLGFNSEADLTGKSAHDAFHYAEEQGVLRPLDECALHDAYLTGKKLSALETVFWSVKERAVPVECTVFPLAIAGRREGSVVVFRDISERKTADRLRWEASHDAITNLPNRRLFEQRLADELVRLKGHGGYGALLFVDLDRFNQIVDRVGSENADRVLTKVAKHLSSQLRGNDLCARLEGDRFALLLVQVQLNNVFSIADSFRGVLRESSYVADGQRHSVAGSIGVVVLSGETASVEQCMEQARSACQKAKKKGRDQTQFIVSDQNTVVIQALESDWGERFRDAIRRNRFIFLAQPVVSTPSLDLERLPEEGERVWRPKRGERVEEYIFELLLRMVNSDGEWISPAVFVPLAERIHIIQEIDMWVIRRALRNLQALGETRVPVSFTVNISNRTLQDAEVLPLLSGMIQATAANPERLIIEITETSAIENMHRARHFIQTLRKLGCRFALDDFGTGFSSFSHIKHLPVDYLKVDGMFVETIAENDVDRTMVESINSMAHSLNLKTIAEHVDTKAALSALRSCGVDYVQGNYLGPPVPLNKINFRGLRVRKTKPRAKRA